MSQTTTPSGADVLAQLDHEIKYCLNSVAILNLSEIRTAVAALIARNAELEAERADRDAVIECKNIDIRERDASIKGWAERARKAEAARDALAAENKALRDDADRLKFLRMRFGVLATVAMEGGHIERAAAIRQCMDELGDDDDDTDGERAATELGGRGNG